MLAVLARLTGKANRIKAGSYEVERGITAWALLLKLTAGMSASVNCASSKAGPSASSGRSSMHIRISHTIPQGSAIPKC